jgi:hypothetical protein
MTAGGLSKARLDRLHGVMAGYVERGEMPGLVTLVSRRGEVHAPGPLPALPAFAWISGPGPTRPSTTNLGYSRDNATLTQPSPSPRERDSF